MTHKYCRACMSIYGLEVEDCQFPEHQSWSDGRQPNEAWETRQVMLSLHKRVTLLEDIIKFEQNNMKIMAEAMVDLQKQIYKLEEK